MKSIVPFLFLFAVLLATSLSVLAQSSPATTDIEQLKAQMNAQQKLLEKQQAHIQALESALAEQQKMLTNVVQGGANGSAMFVPAVEHSVTDLSAGPYGGQAQDNTAAPPDQEPPLAEQEKVEEELQRGPEIADPTPDTPALKLGVAKIRLIGYPALTTVFRTANSGGNVGTSFSSIPFDNKQAGNLTEFRLSPQSTRLALRADLDIPQEVLKAAGYFEMDFAGSPNPGNVAVTSSSYSFRLRQAFFTASRGKWEFSGGQFFSLMTALKSKGITPWPGDVATAQTLDTNYVPGQVYGRYPQIRVAYKPSETFQFAFSAENPEQQVGGSSSGVVFPSALSSELSNEYNTGSNELKVPNTMPDFVLKGYWDGKLGNSNAIHLDVGTVMRVFRSWDGSAVSSHNYSFGWGVGANFFVEVAKGYRLVVQGFASDGAGRYIGGLIPDVIVKANGDISPIHSYAWIGGLEVAPNKATGLYFYYSGAYGQKNATVNSDGTCCVGWGYPGASNSADRLLAEVTGGYSRILWKYENVGSLQWGLQYGYNWLNPWVAGSGPNKASQNMVFGQLRYNLP